MNLLEAAQALANAEREVTRAEADLDEADKALQEASATYRSRNDWAFDARMERDAAIAKMRHLLSLASDEPAALEPATPAGPDTDAEQAGEPEIPEGFVRWPGDPDGKCPAYDAREYSGTPEVEYITRAGNRSAWVINNLVWRHWGNSSDIIAYRILQPAPEPASEQDAAPLPTQPEDAESAPEAAQGAGGGILVMRPGWSALTDEQIEELKREFQAAPITGGLLEPIAPGEVQPDPALHPEHDGTGYWTGTVDGETP